MLLTPHNADWLADRLDRPTQYQGEWTPFAVARLLDAMPYADLDPFLQRLTDATRPDSW